MNRTAEWVSFLLLWLDSPTKTDNSYKYMYMHISNCGHNWYIDFLCRKNIKFFPRLFQCSNIRFNSYILRTIKLSVHWYTSLSERKREADRQTERQTEKERQRETETEKRLYTPPGPRHSCCGRGRTMICRLSSHHGRPTHTDCGRCIYMSPTTDFRLPTISINLYTTHQFLEDNNTHWYFFTILNINWH